MSTISRIALALVIIGGINWGLIGFFRFDLVASLFGGQDAGLARVVYALVGISAVVCLGLLFKPDEELGRVHSRIGRADLRTEFGKEAEFRKDRERQREQANRKNSGK